MKLTDEKIYKLLDNYHVSGWNTMERELIEEVRDFYENQICAECSCYSQRTGYCSVWKTFVTSGKDFGCKKWEPRT